MRYRERRVMNGGVQVAKIFNIPIKINYSWLFIFFLVTWVLGFVYFPETYPALSSTTHLAMGITASILFFSSVLFHELCHSLVARYYGLKIAAINLWIFGGVAQMTDEPPSPGVEFKMSAAGPASSIFLGIAFGILALLAGQLQLSALAGVTSYLAWINLLLAVFNLLPGFPLDGGRVLRSAIWFFTDDLRRATRVASLGGKAIAYLLMSAGFVSVLARQLTGVWFIFLGWVLLQAAETGYRQMLLRQSLEGVTVSEVMTENPYTVDPNLRLSELVHDYFMRYRWGGFPVVHDGQVGGLITLHQVREVPREQWESKTIEEVMTPVSDEVVAHPEDKLTDVLPRLEAEAEGRMLVLSGDHLVGIMTRSDVSRLIRFKIDLER